MSQYIDQVKHDQHVVDSLYERLDNIRHDVKKRLDDVRSAGSHGSPTQRTERDSFATLYEDRLIRLRSVEDRLVFGRLDTVDEKRRYIGRIGLSNEHHEPLLTDWRAEAARAFYEATPKNNRNIAFRRHITLNSRKVVNIEDEVLDTHADNVLKAQEQGTLTGEGALIASLQTRRTSKMIDIVATIQSEQDKIIRAELNKVIVVQGGPGTGKTAVALHRAAYLLYAHKERLRKSGVLIIGPSNSFLHYIDQVLPSLGENGVVSKTIDTLVPLFHTTHRDNDYVAALKGDIRMRKTLKSFISARERIPPHLLSLSINQIKITLTEKMLQKALYEAQNSNKTHNKAREIFVQMVVDELMKAYMDNIDDTSLDARAIENATQQILLNDDIRKTINLAWLPMTPQWVISKLFSDKKQLDYFASWLTEEEKSQLLREARAPLTTSDIPLLDEAYAILGPDPKTLEKQRLEQLQQREFERSIQETLNNYEAKHFVTAQEFAQSLQGISSQTLAERAAQDYDWTYGHIIVDEAQELTPMQWRMLIRRCPSRSFTIVGDVAQTAATNGIQSWEESMNRTFGKNAWKIYELSVNYRNPQEVSHLANDYAHEHGLYISTHKAVRSLPNSVQCTIFPTKEDMHTALCNIACNLCEKHIAADGTGRVAIIGTQEQIHSLPQSLYHDVIAEKQQRNSQYIPSIEQLKKQLTCCTPHECKGLEFDAVISINLHEIEKNSANSRSGASNVYVTLTRPTQDLVLCETQEDYDVLKQTLPHIPLMQKSENK